MEHSKSSDTKTELRMNYNALTSIFVEVVAAKVFQGQVTTHQTYLRYISGIIILICLYPHSECIARFSWFTGAEVIATGKSSEFGGMSYSGLARRLTLFAFVVMSNVTVGFAGEKD